MFFSVGNAWVIENPDSELEKVISGSFSSSVAGESVQIIVNGSDTLTILKKQGNVISG